MGRHARGTSRLRVSVSTVVLGTLFVTVVAAGSLWSSYAQPTPVALDGFQGAAVEDAVADGHLLPYGLLLAGLLAAAAAVAVWVDARRTGRPWAVDTRAVTDTTEAPADAVSPDDADGDSWSTNSADSLAETVLPATADLRRPAPSRHATGRHARPEADAGETARPRLDRPASLRPVWTSRTRAASDPAEGADHGLVFDWDLPRERVLSSVDLSFPFTASLADSLHDELFTHRTVTS